MKYRKYEFENVFNMTGIYSSFYAEYAQDFIGVGESHDFWEIVYCDKGQLWITADKFDYMLKTGEMVFHKPNEYHQIKGDKKTPYNIAIISFDCDSECMNFFENKILKPSDIEIGYLSTALDEGRSFIREVLHPEMGSNFGVKQLAKNNLEAMLICAYRNSNSVNKFNRSFLTDKKTVVGEIALFIRNNLDKNITIDMLVKKFNISKTAITTMFKKSTGMTIKDYVTECKLESAKYYILSEKYNFSQIADMLGFSSIQHFSKFFKLHSNIKLSEYKNSMKKHMK